MPSPYTEADGREFIESQPERNAEGSGNVGVVDAQTGALLGACGFGAERSERFEFGYWVASAHRGRGIAPRALRLIARWVAENTGAGRLQLHADIENIASSAWPRRQASRARASNGAGWTSAASVATWSPTRCCRTRSRRPASSVPTKAGRIGHAGTRRNRHLRVRRAGGGADGDATPRDASTRRSMPPIGPESGARGCRGSPPRSCVRRRRR